MSNEKGPSTRDPGAPTNSAPEEPRTTNTSGRTTFDSRGNAVWQWRNEDGGFSSEVNTQRLKKLEATELTLEDTRKLGQKVQPAQPAKSQKPVAGFNPYDRGTISPSSKQAPPRGNPLATASGAKANTDTTTRKPMKDPRAYSEWLKMKQRLANQKDDDE